MVFTRWIHSLVKLANRADKRAEKDKIDDEADDGGYDAYDNPGYVQPQTDTTHSPSFLQVVTVRCRLRHYCNWK